MNENRYYNDETPECVIESEAVRERAKHNTEQNTIHGHPHTCDGYCATDECVCGLDFLYGDKGI